MSKMFSPASFSRRHATVLIACLILLIVAGQFGITRAASVSKDVLICVNKKSGAMRQVTQAKCAKTERFVRLTSGAAGATGPTGATGPAGAKKDVLICVNKKSGAMRQVTQAKCAKTERFVRLTSGAAGATGPAGAKGDTGAAGAKGDTGAAGAKGDTGAAGAKGDTGAAGAKGDTGAAGAKGDTGAAGAKGDTGAAGAKGDTGAAGTTGATGPAGATGARGLTGPGTVWIDYASASMGGLPVAPIEIITDPVVIECEKPAATPTYRLKMGASASETVMATVSKISVQGSTTTYVVENSATSRVGGDRTTEDIWDIRVFDYNNPNDALTAQYIIRVYLSSNACGVQVWKNS